MVESSFVAQIDPIFNALQSEAILEQLMQSEIDKRTLLKIVLRSVVGFNKVIEDSESYHFLVSIEEHSIYSEEQFRDLVIFISTMGLVPVDEENLSLLHKLMLFHRTVLKTGELVKRLSSLKSSVKAQVAPQSNIISNPLSEMMNLENSVTTNNNSSQAVKESKLVSIPSSKSQQSNQPAISNYEVNEDMDLSEFIRSVKMS